MVRQLVPYAKKYWAFLILGPLTVIIEVILEMRIPLYMSRIVDVGIANSDMDYVLKMCFQMMLLAIAALIAGMFSVRFSAISSRGFGSELRKALFDKVQELSASNLEKFGTASLITRLTTDINKLQTTFMLTVRVLIRSVSIFIVAMFMTCSISRNLSKPFYIAAPILALILFAVSYFSYPRFKKLLKNYDSLNTTVQENLSNIRIVKSFVRYDYEEERFKKSNDILKRSAINAEKWVLLNGPAMSLVMYATTITVMWVGAEMVTQQELLTGQLISFVAYIQQVFSSLILMTNVLVNIIMSRACAQRAVQVLDEKADLTDDNAVNGLEVKDGSVEFKNVCFKFSSKAHENVLENISLKIDSGETVGIIGGTGSGKSTLINLIPRLFETETGEVLISGHKNDKYKLSSLRKAVGLVSQDDILFSGTIRQNLLLSKSDADEDEIIKACQTACAHGFITSFENGYDTVIGQNGVNLSGGQRQRLCIARALLKMPKILIMDDSTSAVDTATEAKIRKELENLKGITKIIIAQRLNSVKKADKIVVLEDGRINAVGTHEQLLKGNGIYKEIYLSQQEGVDL